MSEKELEIVAKVKEIFNKKFKINCTKCKYCMPCPAGVNIPENFTLYNNVNLFNNKGHFQIMYNTVLGEKEKASACVKCGKCETHCPQNIEIIKRLKDVKEMFEAASEA